MIRLMRIEKTAKQRVSRAPLLEPLHLGKESSREEIPKGLRAKPFASLKSLSLGAVGFLSCNAKERRTPIPRSWSVSMMNLIHFDNFTMSSGVIPEVT